jgi:hypothetical protein
MSNVKPGDFARITLPGRDDDGKIVHVEREACYFGVPLMMLMTYAPPWWECTLMAPVLARKEGVKRMINAGGRLPFPDIHLRRIDPPEEPGEDENEQEHEMHDEVKA